MNLPSSTFKGLRKGTIKTIKKRLLEGKAAEMLHIECAVVAFSPPASSELTHRASLCASPWAQPLSFPPAWPPWLIVKWPLWAFYTRPPDAATSISRRRRKKKNLCVFIWRVISSTAVHLMVKSCDAVKKKKREELQLWNISKETTSPIEARKNVLFFTEALIYVFWVSWVLLPMIRAMKKK